MEKYSQYRDRSTGISPFLPNSSSSALAVPLALPLFILKLPILLFVGAAYFLLLQYLPLPLLVRKALLWCLLGIPGIWWIDLQIDGVKKGSLYKQHAQRVPQPGSVIASNFTSPIDALYLAAIFDPIFTVSYPHTRLVQQISLLGAILRALSFPSESPSDPSKLVSLKVVQKKYPKRVIVVFPECTTTNGKGILPFSPSLLSADEGTKIFPISLRHSDGDMMTPLPGWSHGFRFLWCLCGRVTSYIRVRIAQAEVVAPSSKTTGEYHSGGMKESMTSGWVVDVVELSSSSSDECNTADKFTPSEKALLDKVSEALARLGRVKRVGLTVREKVEFIEAWRRGKGGNAKRK